MVPQKRTEERRDLTHHKHSIAFYQLDRMLKKMFDRLKFIFVSMVFANTTLLVGSIPSRLAGFD